MWWVASPQNARSVLLLLVVQGVTNNHVSWIPEHQENILVENCGHDKRVKVTEATTSSCENSTPVPQCFLGFDHYGYNTLMVRTVILRGGCAETSAHRCNKKTTTNCVHFSRHSIHSGSWELEMSTLQLLSGNIVLATMLFWVASRCQPRGVGA